VKAIEGMRERSRVLLSGGMALESGVQALVLVESCCLCARMPSDQLKVGSAGNRLLLFIWDEMNFCESDV